MSLSPTTRGVVFVHSAPAALCPHVEWAIAGVLGGEVNLDWTPQPAQTASYRAELSWDRVYPEKASAMLVDAVERRLGEGSLLISEEWRYGLQAQLR